MENIAFVRDFRTQLLRNADADRRAGGHHNFLRLRWRWRRLRWRGLLSVLTMVNRRRLGGVRIVVTTVVSGNVPGPRRVIVLAWRRPFYFTRRWRKNRGRRKSVGRHLLWLRLHRRRGVGCRCRGGDLQVIHYRLHSCNLRGIIGSGGAGRVTAY